MATPQLIQSINPATEEVLGTFEPATPEAIEQALSEGQSAYRRWRRALGYDGGAAAISSSRRC
jgi:acyl-CoA reductase-like NAD-dependent aldehyde dehydrogenase